MTLSWLVELSLLVAMHLSDNVDSWEIPFTDIHLYLGKYL
jgi:hypothetical protein